MEFSQFRKPIAFLPMAMSAVALLILSIHIALSGGGREPDEGAAAHIWQLLIAGQIPLIAFYAFTRLPKDPKPALRVLAIQALAIAAAVAPVYWLGL